MIKFNKMLEDAVTRMKKLNKELDILKNKYQNNPDVD